MSAIKNGALGALCFVMFAFGFAPCAQAEYTDDCITFSSAASFTLKTNNGAKNWDGTLWTSKDKSNWTEWNGASVAAAQTGGTYHLYVRGNTSNTKITKAGGNWVLAGSAGIACSGNIETMRGATGDLPSPTQMASSCYYGMFRNCTTLTHAPALPATTLAPSCYESMFIDCTALSDAPELPATTLAERCYLGVFSRCTSLTHAPTLPATTLAPSCYESMFSGCTALSGTPELPATTLAECCYCAMFDGCTALTAAPALPATMLVQSCYCAMFEDCTSLTSASALPALLLADYCYKSMFKGCTSLTYTPSLPATLLANGCYCGMFGGCTSLTAVPELPATTLADDCYGAMFAGCTSLTAAPELPAANLADDCYCAMFKGCTSLTAAPELPATNLADDCYAAMFSGCTSLTRVPTLPATTMAFGCYESMFCGCTALTSVPTLPATTLAFRCYESMFRDCTLLKVNATAPGKEWKIPATSTTTTNWGTDMFKGTGGELQGQPGLNEICYIASAKEYTDDCITFSSSASFTLKAIGGKSWNGTLWISADKTFWSEWDGTQRLAAQSGVTGAYTLYVRGNTNNTVITGASGHYYDHGWRIAGSRGIACTGNIEALRGATGSNPSSTQMATSCYESMFSGCTSLTAAPALPATTLASRCYESMFCGCMSLTYTPALPATTLDTGCYSNMFSNCTTLTHAPTLPATTLAPSCYESMFSGCTALSDAPELPATTLAVGCYRGMFYGCSALEINTAAPGREWKIPAVSTVASEWGADMFSGTGGTLQGWPALNTTYYIKDKPLNCIMFSSAALFTLKTKQTAKSWGGTLWTSTDKINWTEWKGNEVAAAWTGDTYNLYVRGNTSNHYITNISGNKWVLSGSAGIACTGNLETLRGAMGDAPSPDQMMGYCYRGMFSGCTSLTHAPALPATRLASHCYSEMFSGCTSLTNAPALPATTLANGCYCGMFGGCTSLTAAPELPATTLADDCYGGMFFGCTSLPHAPTLPATTLAEACYRSMFYDCTSLTDVPALPATTLANYCYHAMFNGCTSLTAAPVLPATTLASHCYADMFEGCTSLTAAPALPATMLAQSCYDEMFSSCTSLTDVPALPATTLVMSYCYSGMFYGCTSLVVNATAPGKEWKLPSVPSATTAADWGTNMFTGTGGTLQGWPALNTTYYIASALQPVEPGGEIVVPEGKAEAKAAEINGDPTVKAQYLKAPEGVVTTANYLGCFDAVATSGSTVAFVLNENGTNDVMEATEAVNAATLDTVFSAESTVTIDKPLVGFYYSFKQGGDVSVGDRADLNKLGGRDTISFELTKGPLQYFYQTLVTPTALPAK